MRPTDRCDDCGFDGESVGPGDAAAAVRDFGARYRAPLTRFLRDEDGDAIVRARPEAGGWSALEYVAHVRDGLALWQRRLHEVLVGDHPVFTDLEGGHDTAAAVADTPAAVNDALAANADGLAAEIEHAPPEGWARTAALGDEEVDAAWIVQHALHEGNHHLLDIGRTLRAVRGR